MKNSFALAVLVSFIFSFSHIRSQGIFLEKGEAGFFADGSYSSLEKLLYNGEKNLEREVIKKELNKLRQDLKQEYISLVKNNPASYGHL